MIRPMQGSQYPIIRGPVRPDLARLPAAEMRCAESIMVASLKDNDHYDYKGTDEGDEEEKIFLPRLT